MLELSISPPSRPRLHPSSSQASTPTRSDLVSHKSSFLLMQCDAEVALAGVAQLRAREKSADDTVIVSTGCLHARSGTYFPRRLAAPPATRTAAHPRARPSDVDQSGAEQDDATTIDCGSICVIHNFLTCNTGRINSLQSAHTRELSAEDVHNGRSGFPSTASSSPIYLHRTVSSRSHRKWAFDGKKSGLDDVQQRRLSKRERTRVVGSARYSRRG